MDLPELQEQAGEFEALIEKALESNYTAAPEQYLRQLWASNSL